MTYNKATHLSENMSRSSVKPLDYIINNSGNLLNNIETSTGIPLWVLIALFVGCFIFFVVIIILKLNPSSSDI